MHLLVAFLILASPNTFAQPWQVFFSPDGGCTDAIVRELHTAAKTIHVQAYSFTSVPIARALLDAERRGVQVGVILDKSQRTEKYSSATFLVNEAIRTLIDDQHAIAHNKVMILDSKTVITGSFNFTKSAEEKNAENLLIIRDPQLAYKYLTNWQAHFAHSKAYERSQIQTKNR